jgi:hypothetical protein
MRKYVGETIMIFSFVLEKFWCQLPEVGQIVAPKQVRNM